MNTEEQKQNTPTPTPSTSSGQATPPTPPAQPAQAAYSASNRDTAPQRGRFEGGRGRGRGGRPSFDRPKPEFDQKILNIRRVTRVVSGGRRFSFSVALIAGDKKGSVGLGTGKATDTSLAIAKALKSAKKNMVKLKLTKEMSIPYGLSTKYSSSKIMIMPNRGKGLVAGGAARDILNIAGVRNVTAKINSGSKNKLNNAKATMKALSRLTITRKPYIATEAEAAVPAPEVTE